MKLPHVITKFKIWYEHRPLREQALTLFLFLAVIYAFVSFFFFNPVDRQATALHNDIKKINGQINNWKTQINALNKIASSPLYEKWKVHHKYFQDLQDQYKFLLKNSSNKQWQDVITELLKSQPNITMLEISNSPESIYSPSNIAGVKNKIYQQQISLTIKSNFNDTVYYLMELEKVLPNIRWDSLSYQVIEYPMAKVKLEFSIIYEKTT
jgi:hypothetical protein